MANFIRRFLFSISSIIVSGLLIALGMLYCPATTIFIIWLIWITGIFMIVLELIPVIFGEPKIDTDHFRRRY